MDIHLVFGQKNTKNFLIRKVFLFWWLSTRKNFFMFFRMNCSQHRITCSDCLEVLIFKGCNAGNAFFPILRYNYFTSVNLVWSCGSAVKRPGSRDFFAAEYRRACCHSKAINLHTADLLQLRIFAFFTDLIDTWKKIFTGHSRDEGSYWALYSDNVSPVQVDLFHFFTFLRKVVFLRGNSSHRIPFPDSP